MFLHVHMHINLAIVRVLLYFQCLRFKLHIFINTLKDALVVIAAGSGLTLDSQKHKGSSWAQIFRWFKKKLLQNFSVGQQWYFLYINNTNFLISLLTQCSVFVHYRGESLFDNTAFWTLSANHKDKCISVVYYCCWCFFLFS